MRDEGIGDIVWDSDYSNNWNRPATLNTYLNSTYYNGLNSTAQSQIVEATYYVGAVTDDNNDIADQINDEKSTTSNVKVALPTLSEYLQANSNKNKCRTFRLNNDNYNTCKNSNWMFNSDFWWTLSPFSGVSNNVFLVQFDCSISDLGAKGALTDVRPVVTLSSEVKITGGNGSKSNPYTLG